MGLSNAMESILEKVEEGREEALDLAEVRTNPMTCWLFCCIENCHQDMLTKFLLKRELSSIYVDNHRWCAQYASPSWWTRWPCLASTSSACPASTAPSPTPASPAPCAGGRLFLSGQTFLQEAVGPLVQEGFKGWNSCARAALGGHSEKLVSQNLKFVVIFSRTSPSPAGILG